MKRRFLIPVFLLTYSTVYANGPSFDCKKASTHTEKEICSRPDLWELDLKIAELYKQALNIHSEPARIKTNQKAWLKKRDAACCSTPQVLKYPNLQQALQMRVQQLKTYINSPGIRLTPGVQAKHRFPFDVLDDIDPDLVPGSVFQYLNLKAEEFLQIGTQVADRYAGMTPESFKQYKPMSFYYGPANFQGVGPDDERSCDYLWELRISLDHRRIYLLEYFDNQGAKLSIPKDGIEMYSPWLNGCELTDAGLKLVFWTNSDPMAAEMPQMKYVEFLYDEKKATLQEVKRFSQ